MNERHAFDYSANMIDGSHRAHVLTRVALMMLVQYTYYTPTHIMGTYYDFCSFVSNPEQVLYKCRPHAKGYLWKHAVTLVDVGRGGKIHLFAVKWGFPTKPQ